MGKCSKAASRRVFLKRCASVALGSASFSAIHTRFQLALAQTAPTNDYKALVCIFLFGGNDSHNMIIPRSTNEYSIYEQVRQTLAVPQADILPITTAAAIPTDYGLHPAMSASQRLFEDGRLAILANAGNLIEPVTKAAYQNRTAALPPMLFSHTDQEKFAQALKGGATVNTGWAGRAADVMQSINTNQRLPMNISLDGSNLFQEGSSISPYSVNGQGVKTLQYFPISGSNPTDQARTEIFRTLLQNADSHLFQKEYADMQLRAWQLAGDMAEVLAQQPILQTPFPASKLATDLKMVARIISARDALQVTRQVFFIGLGSFDTHSNQLNRQLALLHDLSEGLGVFNEAMEELNIADKVTTFTMSDFGRTLTSNGDGTDHGWGSHQLIMGGAVNGGDIYGNMPSLDLNSDDHIGNGRLIPTTSIDQYGATLASWFGLPATNFGTVFPNLHNFNTTDLGFMKY